MFSPSGLDWSGLWIFILVLALHGCTVLCVYDPNNPPTVENTNPAEANPLMNITCLGDHSDLPDWIWQGLQINQQPMHSLCAKPQYGGNNGAPNLAAFCNNGEVVFDLAHQHGLIESSLQHHLGAQLRAMLECRSRCFCNYWLTPSGLVARTDLSAQPKSPAAPETPDDEGSHELELDEQGHSDDWVITSPTTNITYANQVQLQQEQAGSPTEDLGAQISRISISKLNRIVCSGDLPPGIFIQSPYSTSDFNNNQQLCAVELGGGHA